MRKNPSTDLASIKKVNSFADKMLGKKELFFQTAGSMVTVDIDKLKPGMVLARDLSHSDGRLLLSKGLQLDSTHLQILRMWGIGAVEIEDVPHDSCSSTTEEISPAVHNEAEELTKKHFSQANIDHPFLRELFRICVQRQAKQLALQKPSANNRDTMGLEKTPETPAKSPALVSIQKKDLASVLDKIVSLVSLPRIISEIDRVISNPRSSAIHVADVISKDPNLTTKLLKIVNSAFYNFSSRIDTISRAVAIVGTEELASLALGTSVLEMFKGIPIELVDMKSFWEHSVACGAAARIIASHKNIANTERLFVAGLLHDIGRVVVYTHFPQEGRELLLHAKRNNSLLHTAEMKLWGVDHTQIGAMLMQKWKLPVILEQTARYHHQPMLSQYPLEVGIVHIADILVNALIIGTSGERAVPPVIPEVWTALRLSTEIFTRIVEQVDFQVAEVIHNFLGDGY
jgi:putative nucleotidyltransferase with HDIG domain